MPHGDKTKEPTFAMWKTGQSVKQIQAVICTQTGTKPSSVAGWIRDWERGSQHTWTPKIKP